MLRLIRRIDPVPCSLRNLFRFTVRLDVPDSALAEHITVAWCWQVAGSMPSIRPGAAKSSRILSVLGGALALSPAARDWVHSCFIDLGA